MRGKLWLLTAALLGLLAANLHVGCAVSFRGEALEGRYSPADVRWGLRAAGAAVEEILPGEGAAELPRLRYALSLTPPEGESRKVADAALRATEGVAVYDGVFLDGRLIGTVHSAPRFAGRVQAWLFDSMPWGARDAGFSEELSYRSLYTRSDADRDPGEVLAAVTAMAHAWYTDADGQPISG